MCVLSSASQQQRLAPAPALHLQLLVRLLIDSSDISVCKDDWQEDGRIRGEESPHCPEPRPHTYNRGFQHLRCDNGAIVLLVKKKIIVNVFVVCECIERKHTF